MVAMTTAEPWPAAGQLFTVDDLIVPSRLVAGLLPG
jgi:hypothetical protein